MIDVFARWLRKLAAFVVWLTVVLLVVMTMGVINSSIAQAEVDPSAVVAYVQGTGKPEQLPPAMPDGRPIVKVPYRAEITPVYGTQTMDQSSAQARESATQTVVAQLQTGKKVELACYSLGCDPAGDVAKNQILAGVTPDQLTARLMSDPKMQHTGVLNVLQPAAPVLSAVGITPTGDRDGFGPAQPGQVTEVCFVFDAVCDMKDPLRDPFGALNSIDGYFGRHLNGDTQFNYSTATPGSTTTRVDEFGTTMETLHGPLPLVRTFEQATGRPIDPTLERVAEALVTTKTGPGEAPVYKTAPEVASELVDALAPAGVPNLVPDFGFAPEVKAIPQATPAPVAPQQWIKDGISAAENWANTQAPAVQQAMTPVIDTVQSFVAPPAPANTFTAPTLQLPTVDTVVDSAVQSGLIDQGVGAMISNWLPQ